MDKLNVESNALGNNIPPFDPEAVVDQVVSVFGYAKTLDVGCGSKEVVRSLVARGVDAVGVDVSKKTVHGSTERIPDRFFVGAINELPFSENSFEIVTCINSIENISETEVFEVVRELRRVTNKYLFLRILTDCDDGQKEPVTIKDYTWWEHLFFTKGFRTHALIHDIVPYDDVSTISGNVTFAFEKIETKVAQEYPIRVLAEERDLHNDMLRESGPRARAHVARYDLARSYVRPRDRVLDFACGLGYGCETMYRGSNAFSVKGMDDSAFAIRYAKRLYGEGEKITFEREDVASLSASPVGRYDFIASFETIEHLEKPDIFLENCLNTLTPGGRFICSVQNLWVDDDGNDPNPHHLHVFDFDKIKTLIEQYFIIEQMFSQKAGGGLISSHKETSIKEVPLKGEYGQADAEWWIVVGMKDPLSECGCAYRGNFEEEENRDPRNSVNVLSFERDYENPWLLRSMVTMGHRLRNKEALSALAEKVLVQYGTKTADAGAALCVIGYQILSNKSVSVTDRSSIVERIAKYVYTESENPHVIRWQVSLMYFLGKLHLETGEAQLAINWFEECAKSNWKRFSPHLATKVCEAAFSAGFLLVQNDRIDRAKEFWMLGLESCFQAIKSEERSILVNVDKPVLFGLQEIELVVDSAVKCSKALYLVSELQRRPGFSYREMLASLSNVLEQRDKQAERIDELGLETKKTQGQLRIEYDSHEEDRILLHETEIQRDELSLKNSKLVLEAEKLKGQLSVEHDARLEEGILIAETEEQRDRYAHSVDVLSQEAEKLKAQLSVEHDARLKDGILIVEAEEQLNILRKQLAQECEVRDGNLQEIKSLVEQVDSVKKTIDDLEVQKLRIEQDRTLRDNHIRRLEKQLELECEARRDEGISYQEKETVLFRSQEILESEIKEKSRVSEILSRELGASREISLENNFRLSELEFRNISLVEKLRLEKRRCSVLYKYGGGFARLLRQLYCSLRQKPLVKKKNEILHVAQINTHDLVGGAERSSYDLHRTFREDHDLKSDLIVAGKSGIDDDVHKIEYREADWKYAETWRDKWGLTEILYPTPIEGCFKWPHLRNSDITHVHNMHGHYWNSLSLAIFGFQRPTVLTLHDEYTLTGDCCFTYDCERWKQSCGKCPRIGMDFDSRYALGGSDLTRLNILIKRALFRFPRSYPLAIVTPSEWLANRARESKNLRHLPILRIHNGVDLEFWKPEDQAEARIALELPKNKRIGLVVANKLHDPRKGFDIALDAIESLPPESELLFVVVGQLDEQTKERISTLPIVSMGYVDSKVKMRQLFAAADFTFAMSRVDNLPYMCIESLACGRPVLGSKIGGIPEIIVNQSVGWLVESPMLVDRVQEELLRVEREPSEVFAERFTACRQVAEARFSLDLMKQRYLSLYREMIDSVRNRRELDLERVS